MNRLLAGLLVLASVTGCAVHDHMMEMMGMHHGHDHAAEQPCPGANTAAPQTVGEIRNVDAAAQELTVKHGPIENLGMSAMTMAFRVKDPAFLTMVEPGDQVKLTVERVDGVLTIVALERVP